jgi:hypothetical protein
MLPASFQIPAGIVLALCGIVSCFFGYRMFRIVLTLSGFILGAFASSSIFGVNDTGPMVVAAVVGGLLGAGLMFAAYYLGVALVGAGLGALTANVAFAATGQDPNVWVLVLLTIAGAVLAMYLQRYFIIVGTAFGGSWTMILGVTTTLAEPAGDVWVAYPVDPAPGQGWVPVAWIVLGLAGTAVQLGWTGGEKGRVVKRKKKA